MPWRGSAVRPRGFGRPLSPHERARPPGENARFIRGPARSAVVRAQTRPSRGEGAALRGTTGYAEGPFRLIPGAGDWGATAMTAASAMAQAAPTATRVAGRHRRDRYPIRRLVPAWTGPTAVAIGPSPVAPDGPRRSALLAPGVSRPPLFEPVLPGLQPSAWPKRLPLPHSSPPPVVVVVVPPSPLVS